jgi:hypothetical protein
MIEVYVMGVFNLMRVHRASRQYIRHTVDLIFS